MMRAAVARILLRAYYTRRRRRHGHMKIIMSRREGRDFAALAATRWPHSALKISGFIPSSCTSSQRYREEVSSFTNKAARRCPYDVSIGDGSFISPDIGRAMMMRPARWARFVAAISAIFSCYCVIARLLYIMRARDADFISRATSGSFTRRSRDCRVITDFQHETSLTRHHCRRRQ